MTAWACAAVSNNQVAANRRMFAGSVLTVKASSVAVAGDWGVMAAIQRRVAWSSAAGRRLLSVSSKVRNSLSPNMRLAAAAFTGPRMQLARVRPAPTEKVARLLACCWSK